MGANLTLALDAAPQTGAVVCPEINPTPGAPDPREVLRCPSCQLVQFRTLNSHCRRCRADLDAPPVAAAPPAPAAEAAPRVRVGRLDAAEDEGVETAEASGTLVPDVAGAIRRWRTNRGLSQRQLAERMHVPRTYVSKIENDKATPTLASLERMASAMETSVAALLDTHQAELLQDAFVQALVPFLSRLGPRHRDQLLAAAGGPLPALGA
jgi:transcriptional regulator with XRE-family HTH domain